MRHVIGVSLAFALALGDVLPAAALPRLELAPSGGAVWLDPSLGLAPPAAAEFGFGVRLATAAPLAIEATLRGARFEATSALRPRRAVVGTASLGVLASLRPGCRLQPYLGLSGGWAEDASTDAAGALGGPMAEVSLGLGWSGSGGLGLRLEAREGRASQVSGEPVALVRLRSVQMQLVYVPSVGRRGGADTDGDGVSDGLDAFATPSGARVDARGSTTDADRDGVADGIDLCPGTRGGVPVDGRGCPSDSDADGVLDGLDRCAGTAVGSRVDANGCPMLAAEQRLVAEGRLRLACECSAGAPVLAPAASVELDAVARILARTPRLRVEVGAHTDARGTTERNRGASLRCAQAVVDAVRARHPGLGSDRFVVRGWGEEHPLAPNDSEAGRALNRRVEIVLLDAAGPVR